MGPNPYLIVNNICDTWNVHRKELLEQKLHEARICVSFTALESIDAPSIHSIDIMQDTVYYAVIRSDDAENVNGIKSQIGYYHSNNLDRKCCCCLYYRPMCDDQYAGMCSRHMFGVYTDRACCIASYSRQSDIVSENQELLQCIKFAEAQNIDVNNIPIDDWVKHITSIARTMYLQENYPINSVRSLYGATCSCKQYHIGSNTCDCGQNQLTPVVFGDLLNGFEVDIIDKKLAERFGLV